MRYIKLFSALLAALLLSACAESSPVQSGSINSETSVSEFIAEEPKEAQPSPIAAKLSVRGSEECIAMLQELDYREVNPLLYEQRIEESLGISGATVSPVSMDVYDNDSFCMELDAITYSYNENRLLPASSWLLYGAKSDSLSLIVDLESRGYVLLDTLPITQEASGTPCLMTDFCYLSKGDDGELKSIAYVTAAYYPQSGALYNVVQELFSTDAEYGTATIFAMRPSEYLDLPELEIETIQWGDFTVELHPFILEAGGVQYIYQYRPGMSLSDWACSELNTDGWIPWYDDSILSPDRKYIASTGYLAMEELYGNDVLTMSAYEFDGQLDHTYLYDYDIADYVENPDEVMAYLKSEQSEIELNGNINVALAHMVNAKTPLFSPGFRTVGREEGRAAYHSVEISGLGGMFLNDDIIDVYMNEIDEALIPHIKLYAFAESEAFMQSLEGKLILNAHPTPFEQGSEMLKIPENAFCLTFERVPDGQEAPNSPNPRRPGHENLNRNAVFARYVTKSDPNFSGDMNLVFAITFDDELVYWLHMGSHFSETIEGVTWYVNAMGY